MKFLRRLLSKPPRIGVDLHGVLDTYPELFKPLLAILVHYKVEIHIITGPPLRDAELEVDQAGYVPSIHYTHLHSVVDWLKSDGVRMWTDARGRWWASEEDWWKSKSEMCDHLGMLVMIDDSPEYGEYFDNVKTEFVLVGKTLK